MLGAGCGVAERGKGDPAVLQAAEARVARLRDVGDVQRGRAAVHAELLNVATDEITSESELVAEARTLHAPIPSSNASQ